MQSWSRAREVQKIKVQPSKRQCSVAELPAHQQDAARQQAERASEQYPSVPVASCSLHVCEMAGEWEVWLNTDDADFTGLCVSVGKTRDDAVAEAVRVLEAATEALQQPPPDDVARNQQTQETPE